MKAQKFYGKFVQDFVEAEKYSKKKFKETGFYLWILQVLLVKRRPFYEIKNHLKFQDWNFS